MVCVVVGSGKHREVAVRLLAGGGGSSAPVFTHVFVSRPDLSPGPLLRVSPGPGTWLPPGRVVQERGEEAPRAETTAFL